MSFFMTFWHNKCQSQWCSEETVLFSVPIDVINLCGNIRKFRHCGGQAMQTNGAILSMNGKRKQLFFVARS